MASLKRFSEDFRSKFYELFRAEGKQPPNKDYLCAIGTYRKGLEVSTEELDISQGPFCLLKDPETGRWTLRGSNEYIQESFRTLAMRGGIALGCPKDIDPANFWLHRLYRYLCENHKAVDEAPPVSTRYRVGKLYPDESGTRRYLDLPEKESKHLRAATDERGEIVRVCEASATYWSRLEAQALERKQIDKPNKRPNIRKSTVSTKPMQVVKAIAKCREEISVLRPQMHNESQYGKLRQEYRKYFVFKVAEKYSDVKSWLENMQERHACALSQEIVAKNFGISPRTARHYWGHRKASSPHNKTRS